MAHDIVPSQLDINPVLLRIFKQACFAALAFFIAVSLISVAVQHSLKKHFAQQLSLTVRTDLLIGNNTAVLKTLQQNITGNFSSVEFWDGEKRRIRLVEDPEGPSGSADADEPSWQAQAKIPICLDLDASSCSASLHFAFSTLTYIPWILLLSAAGLVIFGLTIVLLQKHVEAYYMQEFQQRNEAAMGRLSARICHDLKLPCLFFQKAFSLDDHARFQELKPQLQSHLLRLYGMIEKLKRVDLEGLVRPDNVVLKETELYGFLRSLAPSAEHLILTMPAFIEVNIDKDKFERAIANLVLNGFQAGATLVAVHIQEKAPDLLVLVENNGPPVPAAFVEAFLSQGSGQFHDRLGLRMVKETVLAHGGTLDLQSGPDRTQFTLNFPDALIKPLLQSLAPEPQPDPTAKPVELEPTTRFIWVDPDLVDLIQGHLTAGDLETIHLTSQLVDQPRCALIVTRQPAIMDEAIGLAVPLLVISERADDLAWLGQLKSRLRLLVQATTKSTHKF